MSYLSSPSGEDHTPIKKKPKIMKKSMDDTDEERKSADASGGEDLTDSSDAGGSALNLNVYNGRIKEISKVQVSDRIQSTSVDSKNESSNSDSSSSDEGPIDQFPLHKNLKQKRNGEKEKPPKIMKAKKSSRDSKGKDEDSKLARLKKYLNATGIKVRSYAKVFEGCKSMKAKRQKLFDMLEEAGIKGKPTLEKCKKLKLKREEEKEIAELDTGNILDFKGAPSGKRIRRHCTRSGWSDANKGRDPIKSRVKHDNNNKDIFGNLGGIVDSEESDGNENPYVASHRRPRGKQKHTFNSDEESIEAGSDCDVRVAKKRRAIVNDDLDDSE